MKKIFILSLFGFLLSFINVFACSLENPLPTDEDIMREGGMVTLLETLHSGEIVVAASGHILFKRENILSS